MNTLRRIGVGLALPASLTVGCGSEGGPEVMPQDLMNVKYDLMIGDEDPEALAAFDLQEKIGSAAVVGALYEPFEVEVGDGTYEVEVSLPDDPAAREHRVVVTANSANSGQILNELGFESHASENRSLTIYGVEPDDKGGFARKGPAISVVGQEYDGVGLYHNMATERCQALDIEAQPQIVDVNVYGSVKEAICNSLGFAADSVVIDESYKQYRDRLEGKVLDPEINTSGLDITYPLVSEGQFGSISGGFEESASSPQGDLAAMTR